MEPQIGAGGNRRNGMGPMAKKKKQDETAPSAAAAEEFETALGKLQQVIGQLEQGNLTLAQSLEAYEQGVGWLKTCYRGLREVEQQIRVLTGVDADGQVNWEAFDSEASAQQAAGQAPRVSGGRSEVTLSAGAGKAGPAEECDDDEGEPEAEKDRSRLF